MTTPPQRCTQPGCTGTIDGGYCTVCGVAAAPAPSASAAAPSGRSMSSGTGGSTSGTGGSTSGTRRSRSGTTRSGRSRSSSRGSLGAGLIEIPPVPYRDPATAVLANPQVPENKRFCGVCERPVGRSRDGRPGLPEGYCPNCGSKFSFSPKLVRGELVAGQYEVLGCLAHGGLGWLYLAMDRNLSNRWVVLKGLLNTTDPAAVEAAVAERRFLAQVEHPSIVGVYNFVQHADMATGEQAGYIVMEYVGGQSLRQLLAERRKTGESMPLPVALAYMIEVLPALEYLHSRGLVYCDFKPDNVIQTEEQLKLIDLGGVRQIDSDDPIYGTVGYQAPEIEADGPSPSSDLYTVGRALAVLTFEFPGYQGEYQHRLPENVPLLAEQESFARLLLRATRADPDRRFQSASEMAEQITGVLREVLSRADGDPRPAFSHLFSPELRSVGTDFTPVRAPGETVTRVSPPPAAEVIVGLPAPLADGSDPAAGYLATLGGLPPANQVAALTGAIAGDAGVPPAVAESRETRLALVRALVTVGDRESAAARLAELAAADPGDWRIAWYTGLCALADGQPDRALAAFNAVYDELPGELAPKLALGFAAEAAGDLVTARRYFQLVEMIDRSYVSAAFGAARACLALGDRPAAIAAVAAVPETSSHHAAAQIAAVRLLVIAGDKVSGSDVHEADGRLVKLSLDDLRREQLTVEILHAALDWVAGGGTRGTPRGPQRDLDNKGYVRILGCEPNERALRFGLERGYRALASLTQDPARKVELVDMANAIRPRTWT